MGSMGYRRWFGISYAHVHHDNQEAVMMRVPLAYGGERSSENVSGLFDKSPAETLRPWGADTFKENCLFPRFWAGRQSCNNLPRLFYTPNPPPSGKRHPIDLRAEVWSAKLELAGIRAELMSCKSCDGGTKMANRYNELKKKEESAIAKVSGLEAKYWDKAWGELERYNKEWEKQKQDLLAELDPFNRLGKGVGKAFLGGTAGLVIGLALVGGVIFLIYRVATSKRTIAATGTVLGGISAAEAGLGGAVLGGLVGKGGKG